MYPRLLIVAESPLRTQDATGTGRYAHHRRGERGPSPTIILSPPHFFTHLLPFEIYSLPIIMPVPLFYARIHVCDFEISAFTFFANKQTKFLLRTLGVVLHRVAGNDTLASGIFNASSALPFLDSIKFAGALGKNPMIHCPRESGRSFHTDATLL
jgi:hypothetical protein